MKITSSEFENNTMMPEKYSCDGRGISPALLIEEVLKAAKSLALIMEDPDAPSGIFVHWVIYNIPLETTEFPEGNKPAGAKEGVNSAGRVGYFGACPPHGIHRYILTLYALDKMLDLKNATADDLREAITDHILEKAELIGLYQRH